MNSPIDINKGIFRSRQAIHFTVRSDAPNDAVSRPQQTLVAKITQ